MAAITVRIYERVMLEKKRSTALVEIPKLTRDGTSSCGATAKGDIASRGTRTAGSSGRQSIAESARRTSVVSPGP